MSDNDNDRDRLAVKLRDAHRLAEHLDEGIVAYMLHCALMELQQRSADGLSAARSR